jgi:hypothetical protein
MKSISGFFNSRMSGHDLFSFVLTVVLTMMIFVSCKKDSTNYGEPQAVNHSLAFNIRYEVDGQPLIFDSLLYINDAGNHYKVSSLVYFLSRISLIKPDSSSVLLSDYNYLDASVPSLNQFSISNPPLGNYIGIGFNIGIDSVHNITGGLPNTIENDNMEWPDLMGGGYHIMKFEGYFEDGGNQYGFAMHLGTNACIVPVRLYKQIAITTNNYSLPLTMNLNEWFRTPSIYDFNLDGNYTMGNMPLMLKLSANGKDAFHF